MRLLTVLISLALHLLGLTNLTQSEPHLMFSSNFNLFTKYKRTFSDVLPIFDSFRFICIISNDMLVLSLFVETHRNSYSAVILRDVKEQVLHEECESVVVLDVYFQKGCKMFNNEIPKRSMFIFCDFQEVNVSSLEISLSSLSTPEVVVISLQDGSLYQLSPVFPRPRLLLPSTVPEVKGRRITSIPTNLKGEMIPVGTKLHPPDVITQDPSNPVSEDLDGIRGILFKELSHRLNFTMEVHLYKDWGRNVINCTNKTKPGLFKALLRGEVELAIANVWQIPSFYALLDLGPTLQKANIAILVRRPELIDLEWRMFFSTLRPEVWLATGATYFLVVTITWSITKWNKPSTKKESHMHTTFESHTSSNVGISSLIAFGILTGASYYAGMSEKKTRFILTIWAVCSLLITTALSTGLLSKLTVPIFSPRVDTIKEMAENKYVWIYPTYRLFTRQTKHFIFDFSNPFVVLFEKQYIYVEPMKLREIAMTEKKILFLSETQNGGLIAVPNAENIGQDTLRMFRKAREVTSSGHVTFGVRKHSPLLEPLTVMTLKCLEAGLPKKWLDDVLQRWPIYNTKHLTLELDRPTFTEPKPLRLRNMQAIFYMLLLGLGFAFILFICELLYSVKVF